MARYHERVWIHVRMRILHMPAELKIWSTLSEW